MNQYVLLAKKAVENYINQGKIIETPKGLPKVFLTKKAGVFVTIKKQEELRGCIGTYLPTRPDIAQEIINNAIVAATEDNRFNSIKKEELSLLSYEISVLEYPELVKNLKELNPKKFGIIVKTAPFVFPDNKTKEEKNNFDNNVAFRSGVLLPDLPGIEKPEEQFIIACQKANIDPVKEKTFVYKFKTNKFE